MIRSGLACTGLSLMTAAGVWAQPPSPDTRPVFEVASVKPSTSGINGLSGGCRGSDSIVRPSEIAPPPLGRCSIRDARLSHMIAIAYDLKKIDDIQGAPVWAISGTERFDVEAKAVDPRATAAELKLMLQRLLEDRFQLRYRWEEKEVSGAALVVQGDAVKLKAAAGDPERFKIGPNPKPGTQEPVHIEARKQPIGSLTQFLTWFEPYTVADETGLKGVYDFDLSWDGANGPTLETALRQQLGLRLERRKVYERHFIFASAEHPSAN